MIYLIGLLERCPYDLWDRVDVPCDMFPDSSDPDICTSLAQPQNGAHKYKQYLDSVIAFF